LSALTSHGFTGLAIGFRRARACDAKYVAHDRTKQAGHSFAGQQQREKLRNPESENSQGTL